MVGSKVLNYKQIRPDQIRPRVEVPAQNKVMSLPVKKLAQKHGQSTKGQIEQTAAAPYHAASTQDLRLELHLDFSS